MELYHKRYGRTGRPLVILHGLLGSGGNWHTLSRNAFSEHFTVYTVDQRNHGRSPHSEMFGYPPMVEDLLEFVQGHDLGAVYLLGHSMGGKTAMHFALEYGEHVEKLVVVDIAPKAYPPHHLELLEAMRELDVPAFETREALDEALAADVPSRPVRQFLLKNLTYDRRDEAYEWQPDLETIYRNYERLNEAIAPGLTYDGPALFIRGADSSYLQEDDETLIQTLFPQARMTTVKGAGHWVHADQPEAFARVVLDFLLTS